MEIVCKQESDLPEVAKSIIEFAGDQRVWLLSGDLGAGKTTLIKEICKCMGVEDAVTSPTFALVNEYGANGPKVYHFDFYRINDEIEALDIGFDEYLGSGKLCLIEWPEKIEGLWPSDYLSISINNPDGDQRIIKLEHYGGTAEDWI